MYQPVAAGRTEKGTVRKTNDDAFRLYGSNDYRVQGRGTVFAVADGIGSYRAGGQAAEMAVDQLALYFRLPPGQYRGPATLEELIFSANAAITSLRTRGKEYYGMGCTLTALLVHPAGHGAIVYQVGDSMAYLVRNGKITPITTPQQAEDESLANHMGLGDKLRVEKVKLGLRAGDTVLLCSDGVSGVLKEEELLETMVVSQDPEACVDAVVNRALATSRDNVTAVIVKIR